VGRESILSELSNIFRKYSCKLFTIPAVFSKGYQDSMIEKVASEEQSNLTYIVLDVLEAEGYSYSDCE
jgi:hypothetical protein